MVWSGRRPGPWTGRSLRDHGLRVIPAHPEGAAGAWDPTGDLLRYPDPVVHPAAFLDWVEDRCRVMRIDAVVALDERAVELLGHVAPEVGGAVVVGPDRLQYRALCDKAVLPDTCAAAGVGHPDTAVVPPGGAAGPLPGLPCIVKPARSAVTLGPDVPFVAVARTRGERADMVERITGAGGTAIVQRRLEGPQWGVYCAATPEGVVGVAAAVLRTAPRAAGTPSRFAVGHADPGLVDLAGRLLGSVGYSGVANLDVIEAEGRFHVLDVNLRPAASAALPVHAGVHLVPTAVLSALGLPVPEPGRRPPPFTYVSVEGELGVLTGRDPAARPVAVVAALVRDALHPRVRLDPPPSDVRWLASLVRGAVLRRSRQRAPAVPPT